MLQSCSSSRPNYGVPRGDALLPLVLFAFSHCGAPPSAKTKQIPTKRPPSRTPSEAPKRSCTTRRTTRLRVRQTTVDTHRRCVDVCAPGVCVHIWLLGGYQGVCPGMQKVFWRQKCPGTRGVRDNRRPGTVLAVPGHLASSQDTYAVLGRCCPKTANCPGTGAGVPGPPSWDTRCPGTPRVPGHFLVLRNAPP